MNAFEEDGFIHVDMVAFNNSDLYYVHFYVDSMLDNVRQLKQLLVPWPKNLCDSTVR